jgi:replicative DNA helicase
VALCSEISKAAYNEATEYSAGEFANRLLQTEAQATDTVHISGALSSFLDWQMERVEMRERGQLGLLPTTHIPELDNTLVYLEPGQETIIAGEPGVGKTMLVQQIIEGNENNKSIIFSMEMRATRLTARLVSGRSGIPVSAMRLGLPNDNGNMQSKINQAVAELETAGIYINDRSGITVEGMYAESARLIAQGHKLSLCAIDYFGLIADASHVSGQTEREEIVSAKLQRMFRQLNIHGLVIDTYNKAGFNGTQGRMGSITGAARKSYDADNVITLTLGDIVPESGQLVHADIVKVRDGEISQKRVSLMREIGKPRYRSLNENERNNLPIA